MRLAAQTVPNLINYQGRLTDSAGVPLAIANYGVEFRLWDSPTGTNLIWGQRQNVAVQANGVFNAILGAPGGGTITNQVPAVNNLGFAFTSSNRFLGLTVVASNGAAISSASEILPRQQLQSVPFAMLAQQVANGAIGSQQLSASSINASNLSAQLTLDSIIPAGSVSAFAAVLAPSGWFTCDGLAVSRTTYARLFSVIGPNHGSGDGSNTFNLPDYRGRFLRMGDYGTGHDPDSSESGGLREMQLGRYSPTNSRATATEWTGTILPFRPATSSSVGPAAVTGSPPGPRRR